MNILKLTPEQIEEITKRFLNMEHVSKIAQSLNISESSIYKNIPEWAKQEKQKQVRMRGVNILTKEDKEDIIKLFDEGNTIASISRELGVAIHLIHKYIDRERLWSKKSSSIDIFGFRNLPPTTDEKAIEYMMSKF